MEISDSPYLLIQALHILKLTFTQLEINLQRTRKETVTTLIPSNSPTHTSFTTSYINLLKPSGNFTYHQV
jgi:hypothetical protein